MSVDVAWAPGGIDGRHYDYAALGRHADMLFVMGYCQNKTLNSFIVIDMKENNAKGMMSRVRCGGRTTALQNPTHLSEKLFMGSVVVSFLC